MDDMIKLVNEVFSQDDLGIQESAEVVRDVWASIQSAGRAEWAAAGQSGLQPSMVAVMPALNYNGEKIAIVQEKHYSIYRTYAPPDSDYIELYLKEKAGV